MLKQLAPIQLAMEHLPSNIIDILERLRNADNIPFNQLYYIAEIVQTDIVLKSFKPFVSISRDNSLIDRLYS